MGTFENSDGTMIVWKFWAGNSELAPQGCDLTACLIINKCNSHTLDTFGATSYSGFNVAVFAAEFG